MALAIVIVLIGIFAALCQTLTMLVAIQFRLAFQQTDQAQARRLAEAGLLRGQARLEREPDWTGETWTPALPGGGNGAVELVVTQSGDQSILRAMARFTTTAGRIHQSHQTLDVGMASAKGRNEGAQP
ncbi:hypothetical protein [Caulifigura coniformis]|nr:hypothetical protein [Caulifigura coniformis]